MMLFGEKYGDSVRVLSMGNVIDERHFSIELCGGIHVQRTGDIGFFKIISEGGIAAGIRRIEALTGMPALEYVQQLDQQIGQINQLTKAARGQSVEKVQSLQERTKDLEKQLERMQQKLAQAQSAELLTQVQTVGDYQLLPVVVTGVDGKALRTLHDSLKSRISHGIIVLAGVDGDKASLIASVAGSAAGKVKAGDIIGHLAQALGGKGGGKPDLAQGGAPLPAGNVQPLEQLMQQLPTWIQQQA